MIKIHQIETSPERFSTEKGEEFTKKFHAAFDKWARKRGIDPAEESFRAKAGRKSKRQLEEAI